MLSPKALRRWSSVHRWTSLVSTLFLLILCVTGLPLIFHDEIDQALGYAVTARGKGDGQAHSTDAIIRAVLARHPGRFVQFVLWDPDTPGVVALALGRAPDSPPGDNQAVYVDAGDGSVLAEGALKRGPMGTLLKLHGELFLGPAGPVAIGIVALLFLAALFSGVVVYAPFLRRLPFGALRTSSRRIRWLDLHNLLGMTTLAWATIVGGTGLINSWGDLAVNIWQASELSHMAAAASPQVANSVVPVDTILVAARAAAPGMTPLFVAMPGSALTSRHHFGVFMRGDTPLTEHLLKPVLIDAGTGTVVGTRDLPWYMQVLFLAQPLHFGDYGGLPLKVLWALFDLATILVLASGLYLWLGRRLRGAPFDDSLPERTTPP
jgi:uncharacterized iron-regulated membrane protein